ncbi:hypothetical protein BH09ACT1_BH09ACT1_29460 [soil metagenome]
MSADTTPDAVVPEESAQKVSPVKFRYGWASVAIAILFGLLYAYDLFSAISNVVGVTSQLGNYNAQRAVVKLDPVPVPWVWLVIDLIAPPVLFGFAFVLGRRRTVVERFVIFLIGFGALSALSLSVIALA